MRLAACHALAENSSHEAEHARQVTRLALALFDQLLELHRLSNTQRQRLEYAGLLHDIGWKEGGKGHHKASLRSILGARELPFDKRERRIVACVARYHRGRLPIQRHRAYGKLAARDQRVVQKLAAILRVADGLDRSHGSVVDGLRATVSAEQVTLTCTTRGPAVAEREAALKKSDLFTKVFRRSLVVECSSY